MSPLFHGGVLREVGLLQIIILTQYCFLQLIFFLKKCLSVKRVRYIQYNTIYACSLIVKLWEWIVIGFNVPYPIDPSHSAPRPWACRRGYFGQPRSRTPDRLPTACTRRKTRQKTSWCCHRFGAYPYPFTRAPDSCSGAHVSEIYNIVLTRYSLHRISWWSDKLHLVIVFLSMYEVVYDCVLKLEEKK